MSKAEIISSPEPECAMSDAEILEQLDRIVSSDLFTTSPRLQQMLIYIVQRRIDGQAELIKGVTIAQDVFGRTDPEDAQTSTVVSVEARRLRRRLDDYYAEPGVDDQIVISVPKGAFVPVFTWRDLPSELPETSARRFPKPILLALGAVALAMVVVVGLLSVLTNSPPISPILKPSIAVLPFRNAIESVAGSELAKGLTEDLITDLSALSEMDVIAYSSVILLPHSTMKPTEIGRELRVSHILRGSLRGSADNLRVTAELTEVPSGKLIWAQRFDEGGGDILKLQDVISQKVLGSLSIPFGADRNSSRGDSDAPNSETLALFKQAMDMANPPSDPARLMLANAAFQAVIDSDPDFAGGYAGRAYIGAFRAKFGHADHPMEQARLSAQMASVALDIDPDSALAHHAMAFSQLVLGDFTTAIESSENAAKIAPNDPYAQSYHGFLLAANGHPKDGLPFAKRALRLDPLDPRTPYLNILGVIQFNAGEYENALQSFLENRRRGGPVSRGNDAHLAATYAALGKEVQAREILSRLPQDFVEGSWASWRNRSFRSAEDAERALGFIRRLK